MLFFATIVLYVAVMLAVGVWKSRTTRTQEDFMVAGRNVSTWYLVGTLVNVAYLDKNFSGSYLDFQFFDQIIEAVRYIGEHRLKVANLSLGTSFEKPVFEPGAAHVKARFRAFMRFVVYEYFKYAVATTIEKYATKTLFVIASGNEIFGFSATVCCAKNQCRRNSSPHNTVATTGTNGW